MTGSRPLKGFPLSNIIQSRPIHFVPFVLHCTVIIKNASKVLYPSIIQGVHCFCFCFYL